MIRPLHLVDDEEDFRHGTSQALNRRGFTVTEAAGGEDALAAIKRERPDIVLLDLKMAGMSGIETLQHIQDIEVDLPVIILTGHADFDAAVAGIKLDIVDFLQKPVDVELLGARICTLLERAGEKPLRERTIAELMIPPSQYPRLYVDQPVAAALAALRQAFLQPVSEGAQPGQVRSALVYERSGRFLGLIHFVDLLKLVLPAFLADSPYTTFFTGMFLAQCKVIGNRNIRELMKEQVFVDVDAPLMAAVHLMVEHRVINLPVMEEGEPIRVLRERDIIFEIAENMEV